MQTFEIIQAILKLPLQKQFFIVEETLKAIKNRKLNRQGELKSEEPFDHYLSNSDLLNLAEKSFSEEWQSKEDNRWDDLL
jgi:hypothetical protein